MPIKNTPSYVNLPKKVIYIDWHSQTVYTQEEYDDEVREAVDEMIADTHTLGEYISDNYDYQEVGRLLIDDQYRTQVLSEYRDWCYASVMEDKEYERYEI